MGWRSTNQEPGRARPCEDVYYDSRTGISSIVSNYSSLELACSQTYDRVPLLDAWNKAVYCPDFSLGGDPYADIRDAIEPGKFVLLTVGKCCSCRHVLILRTYLYPAGAIVSGEIDAREVKTILQPGGSGSPCRRGWPVTSSETAYGGARPVGECFAFNTFTDDLSNAGGHFLNDFTTAGDDSACDGDFGFIKADGDISFQTVWT